MNAGQRAARRSLIFSEGIESLMLVAGLESQSMRGSTVRQ